MLRPFLMLALGLSGAAQAKTLNIATDIAPIHSLVSAVVGDRQEVSLIVPQNADPHHFSLRPQQAADLQNADLVFYVGRSLLPWFESTALTLAPQVRILSLEDAPLVEALKMRVQGEDEHVHMEDTVEPEAGHEEDHDGGHDEEDTHEEAGEAEDTHDHGHDPIYEASINGFEGIDPHLWLDPDNAGLMVHQIASALVLMDIENGAYYLENAAKLMGDIEAFRTATIARFEGLSPVPFLVGHDAFQYFEHMLDVTPNGFVTDALGTAPTINTMRELSSHDAQCILVDENENGPHSEQIAKRIGAKLVFANPTGTDLPLGPDLYLTMMENLADDFAACLGVSQ